MHHSETVINEGTLAEDRGRFCVLICWSYIDTLVSGSTMIQDGTLVGAVHTFLSMILKRGGIFIENMSEGRGKNNSRGDEPRCTYLLQNEIGYDIIPIKA